MTQSALTKDEIQNFFNSRKMDFVVSSVQTTDAAVRVQLSLGARGKVSSLGKVMSEFGLFVRSISVPTVSVNYPKSTISIFAPTKQMESTPLSAVENDLKSNKFFLPIPMGVDVYGNNLICDLSEAPHMLVGGTTGSGKSMFLHSCISGLMSARTNKQVEFILFDPKCVEFQRYKKSKYLNTNIANSNFSTYLKHIISIMNLRFSMMQRMGVRDLKESCRMGSHMPSIVVMIDEAQDVLSDKECESMVVQIAQKGRAAGIHLIIATQHPNRDILTPNIKSNIPVRVAFRTASSVYSRVLMDETGAESLLGKGDGLYKGPDGQVQRFKGFFTNPPDSPAKSSFWDRFL